MVHPLANAFFKNVESHAYAVDFRMVQYYCCRLHMTLTKAHDLYYPTTPAAAAANASHVWFVEDTCGS
ncbi:MAG: hypothetical protein H7Y22_04220 [Gemmatimonadaceae bacterium]|nr:hypothetical protein [Gloeobacterales cyanobacterium ES-bin-141]